MKPPPKEPPMSPIVIPYLDEYQDSYIALDALINGKVIAHGKNPIEVHERAKNSGIKDPIIAFIPRKDSAHIY